MWKTLHEIGSIGVVTESVPATDDALRVAERLQKEILTILGRALCIRQVDAGPCNGCELEIHALNNPLYNVEGLGIIRSWLSRSVTAVARVGVFCESYANAGRVANVIPVDVAVPGCPPSPNRILTGVLTAISARRR